MTERKGVDVAWCDPGEIDGAFAESVIRLLLVNVLRGTVRGFQRVISGPVLSKTRSDICEKLGMLAGTFHDHLDQKFRLMTVPETEREIEPEIETKPEEPPVTPPSEDLAALVQEVQSLKERVAKLEAKLKGLKELL